MTASYCLTNDAAVTITVHNAANAVVRTLATSDPQVAGYCYSNPYLVYDNSTPTWDGKNTGGAVVPDGNYTIDIHAVAGSETDDLSIPTTVDTRVPGAITTPAPNATLTETANFVFTPTANFPTAGGGIQQVTRRLHQRSEFSPSPTAPTSDRATPLVPGRPAQLHAHVWWTDQYGNGALLDLAHRSSGHPRHLWHFNLASPAPGRRDRSPRTATAKTTS